MVFYLISVLLLFLYCWLILFYRQSWLKIKDFTSASNIEALNPVFISVIIAARNEEKNILDDYPDSGSRRRNNEIKDKKEMKKLVASRYALWKEGKYQ